MSIYAKYQDDKAELSHYFSFFLSMIVRVAFPLCAVIFVFAGDIVDVVFGSKWLPMVSPLRWLLVYSLLRPIYDDTGAFFTAIGKPRTISLILATQAVIMFFLVPLLTWYFGIVGTAVAADIVMLVGVVLAYRKVSEHIDLPYTKIFVMPLVCVIIAYLSYYLIDRHVSFSLPIVNLMAGAGFFLAVYCAVLMYFERDEVRKFFKLATEKG
jgi:O-antigen/teichoic acid export membrane protein